MKTSNFHLSLFSLFHLILLNLLTNTISHTFEPSFLSKNGGCFTDDAKRDIEVMDYIAKNSNNLTDTDKKLLHFIAGPCLPVIMLPGLYGTKLQVHITNCTELNIHHPDVAKDCGFDKKCTNGYDETIWISESFFNSEHTNDCGARLINIEYEKNNVTNHYEQVKTKGYRVTYYGDTPKTKADKRCGFGCVTNILDKKFYYGQRFPRGDLDLQNAFLALGYEIGINFFAVPTDWRKLGTGEFNFKIIEKTVNLAYKLTGKKAMIIGHSFGALTGLSYIYNLSQEEKDQKVARFISVGGPLLGVAKSLKGYIMSMNDFNSKVTLFNIITIMDLYITTNNQKIYVFNFGVEDLLPKTHFYKNNQNEEWIKIAIGRSDVENKITECVRNLYKNKTNR